MAQHEAIELCFRQLESSCLFNGVLCRDHKERRGEIVRGVTDRNASFLHRFEERRLHLWARTIDFVGEKQVREDRSLVDAELARLLIENLAADDVARQKIDGELHACESKVDGLCDGLDEQCLRNAWDAFEKKMAASKKRDQHALDDRVLSNDRASDLRSNVIDEW